MRKSDRLAEEKRREKEKFFKVAKKGMNAIFSLSTARVNLGTALFFDSPHVSQQKRNDLFENMVQKNAEYCLSGDPEAGGTAEDHCIVLIGRVDFWPHARPALERAVKLSRENGKPISQSLREWTANPGDSPPQMRGQDPRAQHWKVMRDQIICWAIDWVVTVQEDPRCLVRLSIRRDRASDMRKKDYSIFRAVIEVLDEIYGGHKDYRSPSLDMVRGAWRRYQTDILGKGKPRPGRPLLQPQSLELDLNHLRAEMANLMQTLLNISEEYLCECAQRDLDGSQ